MTEKGRGESRVLPHTQSPPSGVDGGEVRGVFAITSGTSVRLPPSKEPLVQRLQLTTPLAGLMVPTRPTTEQTLLLS